MREVEQVLELVTRLELDLGSNYDQSARMICDFEVSNELNTISAQKNLKQWETSRSLHLENHDQLQLNKPITFLANQP